MKKAKMLIQKLFGGYSSPQNKARRALSGFAVLFIAAIFSFTLLGCDTDGGGSSSGGGSGSLGWPDSFTLSNDRAEWFLTPNSNNERVVFYKEGPIFRYATGYSNTATTDERFTLVSFTGDGSSTGSFTVKDTSGTEKTVTYSISGDILTLSGGNTWDGSYNH